MINQDSQTLDFLSCEFFVVVCLFSHEQEEESATEWQATEMFEGWKRNKIYKKNLFVRKRAGKMLSRVTRIMYIKQKNYWRKCHLFSLLITSCAWDDSKKEPIWVSTFALLKIHIWMNEPTDNDSAEIMKIIKSKVE